MDNNIMVDIETMGKGSNAAILSIGAVRFDEKEVLCRFHEKVCLQSSLDIGLEMDASTVMWWMEQGDEARKQFGPPALPIKKVLEGLAIWMGFNAKVWGNGASFDNAILANAYNKAGLELPWKFYNDRCYRTMKSLHRDIKMERIGVHHSALDDAESQAIHLINIFKQKNITSVQAKELEQAS